MRLSNGLFHGLSVLCLGALGCSSDSVPRDTVVTVAGLPLDAAVLRVLARLDDTPAAQTPELNVHGFGGGDSYAFDLRLPAGASGRSLLIALEALDESGCLIA